MMNVIEYDAVCAACKGSGLYMGMAERSGAAVVCHDCKGTGCRHVKIEYESFKERSVRIDVGRVFETNPGICIGAGEELTLRDFGGMDYPPWLAGNKFPPKSENRKFTCPAWWYQSANYSKKPDWDECIGIGSFSGCEHFNNKDQCWKRWDKENETNE